MHLMRLHSLRVLTSDQNSIMSSSNPSAPTRRPPSPRSRSLVLPATLVNQLQVTLTRRTEVTLDLPPQSSAVTATVELKHGLRPRLVQNRRPGVRPAFSIGEQQAPSRAPEPRMLVGLQPAIADEPLSLTGSAPQGSSHAPGFGAQPVASSLGQPAQPEVVRDANQVSSQISKAFANTNSASAWRNKLREPGGQARLPAICEGLFKMIDRLNDPSQKAHLYGQLVLQLVSYGGVDESLTLNKARYGAAYEVMKQVAGKLLDLQGDVTSVIVWSNVNKLVLDLQGLSSGKAINKLLVSSNEELQKTLRMSPKEADQHIKAVLAAQVLARR